MPGTLLEKTDSAFPSRHQLQIASWLEIGSHLLSAGFCLVEHVNCVHVVMVPVFIRASVLYVKMMLFLCSHPHLWFPQFFLLPCVYLNLKERVLMKTSV